jgi:hypothetical protein
MHQQSSLKSQERAENPGEIQAPSNNEVKKLRTTRPAPVASSANLDSPGRRVEQIPGATNWSGHPVAFRDSLPRYQRPRLE